MRARLLALLTVVAAAAAGCTSGPQAPGDAGPDAAATDAFIFSFPCGDMLCAPTQLCAVPIPVGDGGTPPATCAELPALCGGAPTCACLATTCTFITGATCVAGVERGLIYCWR